MRPARESARPARPRPAAASTPSRARIRHRNGRLSTRSRARVRQRNAPAPIPATARIAATSPHEPYRKAGRRRTGCGAGARCSVRTTANAPSGFEWIRGRSCRPFDVRTSGVGAKRQERHSRRRHGRDAGRVPGAAAARAEPGTRLRARAGRIVEDSRAGSASPVRSTARAEGGTGDLYRGGPRSAGEGAAVRARPRCLDQRRHPSGHQGSGDPQRHRPDPRRDPRPHRRPARHPPPPAQRCARDRAGHPGAAKLPDRLRQRGARSPFQQLHRDPGVGGGRRSGQPRQQLLDRHRQPLEQPVLGDDDRRGAWHRRRRDRLRPRFRSKERGRAARPARPGGYGGPRTPARAGLRLRTGRRRGRDPESGGGNPPRARDRAPAPRDPGLSRRRARQRPPPGAHRGDDRRDRAERPPPGRRRLEPARPQRRGERAAEPAGGKPGGRALRRARLRGRVAGRPGPGAERDGAAPGGVRQGAGAVEPEARGPEQPDRGAEGDPQHRLLRGERRDRERE